MLFKLIITGFIIYFIYKFTSKPSLKGGDSNQQYQQNQRTFDSSTQNKGKQKPNNKEEYIDYEEVD